MINKEHVIRLLDADININWIKIENCSDKICVKYYQGKIIALETFKRKVMDIKIKDYNADLIKEINKLEEIGYMLIRKSEVMDIIKGKI